MMAYEESNKALHGADLHSLCAQYPYIENSSPRSKSPETRRGVRWSSKLVEILYFDPNSKDLEDLKKDKLTYTFYDVAAKYLNEDRSVLMEKGIEYVKKEINCRNTEQLGKNTGSIQEQVEEWV